MNMKIFVKYPEWKSIDEYMEEQIFHAQTQLSPYTATGKYLRQICDNFQIKYKVDEPDEVVRERFFKEVKLYKEKNEELEKKNG